MYKSPHHSSKLSESLGKGSTFLQVLEALLGNGRLMSFAFFWICFGTTVSQGEIKGIWTDAKLSNWPTCFSDITSCCFNHWWSTSLVVWEARQKFCFGFWLNIECNGERLTVSSWRTGLQVLESWGQGQRLVRGHYWVFCHPSKEKSHRVLACH